MLPGGSVGRGALIDNILHTSLGSQRSRVSLETSGVVVVTVKHIIQVLTAESKSAFCHSAFTLGQGMSSAKGYSSWNRFVLPALGRQWFPVAAHPWGPHCPWWCHHFPSHAQAVTSFPLSESSGPVWLSHDGPAYSLSGPGLSPSQHSSEQPSRPLLYQ